MATLIKIFVKYNKYLFYLLVVLVTIMLCIGNHNLRTELKDIKSRSSLIPPEILYDTVYINKPFITEEPYKKVEEPSKVVIFNKPEDSILVDHKIISMDFNTDMIKLSTSSHDSIFSDNYYPLNLQMYNYRYIEGKLSKQKIPLIKRFRPYVGVSYRPFNNLYDLYEGISFKTKKFNYKLGLNLSYYPKFSSKVNLDLELAIIYNF